MGICAAPMSVPVELRRGARASQLGSSVANAVHRGLANIRTSSSRIDHRLGKDDGRRGQSRDDVETQLAVDVEPHGPCIGIANTTWSYHQSRSKKVRAKSSCSFLFEVSDV